MAWRCAMPIGDLAGCMVPRAPVAGIIQLIAWDEPANPASFPYDPVRGITPVEPDTDDRPATARKKRPRAASLDPRLG